MSVFSGRSHTKLHLIKEAAGAGATLVGVTDVITGSNTALSGALSAMFGGSFAIDAFSCMHFSTGGVPYLFVQPYSGVYPMPGEHHVWLQGSLRAPTNWSIETFSDKWISPDPATVFALEQNRMLTSTLRGVRWDWKLGRGTIQHPWVLQTRPFRGGLTHLTMKATGETQGLSGRHTAGCIQLLQIAMRLQPSLVQAPGYPEYPFLVESRYTSLFSRLLENTLPPSASPGTTPPADFSQAIMQALSQAPGGKLYLHPLAPVKDSCARNFILPPAARHLPIVAAIDTTLMNSLKDGFVFTPTHGFYKSDDAMIGFAWTDVRGIRPLDSLADDWLVLSVVPYGEIVIPTAGRAGPMAQLFHWFSQLP